MINDEFVNTLYETAIKHLSRKSLKEIVEHVFKGKEFVDNLDWKYPIYPFFYIKEEFNNTPSKKEMQETKKIYNSLRRKILSSLPKEEASLIDLYKSYGSIASHRIDIDERRASAINNILQNNCINVDTPYGNLIFEFATHKKYKVGDKTLCAFDTDTKHIILFVNNSSNITTLDLIKILRHRNRFTHELSHYIDDINNNLSYEEYDDTEEGELAYINNPSEFKADAQTIVSTFGSYLFKNQNDITNNYNLTNKKDIEYLFNIFLTDESSTNVIDSDDLSEFRKRIVNWTDKNKQNFGRFLYEVISNTQDLKDFDESKRQDNLLKLLSLEESFLKE